MKANIVIITSIYLHSYIEKVFKEFHNECDVTIVDYTTFEHIGTIYRKYEDTADGFMISGSGTVAAIKHDIGEFKKPVISFQADWLSFYHALVTLFLARKDLDSKRCIFDFLLPLSHEFENTSDISVEYLIRQLDQKQLDITMNEWIDANTIGNFSLVISDIADKTLKLWNSGKIDMVLCSYSSLAPILESNGIPYYFFYPVKSQLEAQIRELLSEIQFENYIENLPAAIAITEFNGTTVPESKEKFYNIVQKIKKDFLIDAITQFESGTHYIYTTRRVILMITKNFETGYFTTLLENEYQLSAAVGYGIGNTITEAKKHAEYALHESKLSGGCFAMTESRQLIGPLDSSKLPDLQQNLSETLFKTAEACKLSTLTLQKLISIIKITGSREFTTKELASYLKVTDRNANRILRNLENGGAATIIHTRSTTSKGRPVKVYQLNL